MARFKIGDRVRILPVKMTHPRICMYGTIKNIDGAYILVHPDTWPLGERIELYPCEITHIDNPA